MSPSHVHEWMASDSGNSYKGDTLVSFGVGIDLTTSPAHFKPEAL